MKPKSFGHLQKLRNQITNFKIQIIKISSKAKCTEFKVFHVDSILGNAITIAEGRLLEWLESQNDDNKFKLIGITTNYILYRENKMDRYSYVLTVVFEHY